jgi:putative transcriptional regulator
MEMITGGGHMNEQRLHYTACGLDNVYLLNGFHFHKTSRGRVLKIDEQQDLHRAIGAFLIRQKRSLAGKELRFLRQELDLSQTRLASLLGESEQSVARREKGRKTTERPTSQERLLRFLFEEHAHGNESLTEFLRALAEIDEHENGEMEFRNLGTWQRAVEPVAA